MFGVFPIIPYPMQQKQRLIKHLRDSLTTCLLELSSQIESADRTAGTRVSQHCRHCPGDTAGLFCFPCASAPLLWDTAVCPRLDPLMENEKHESFVYLNNSLWPLMRGHSFEFRATMFSEAGTLRKVPTDTRDFGVTVCSLMKCACVSLCPHCSCALAVSHQGSTSWEKLWKSSLPKSKLLCNNHGRCLS